MNRAFFIESTAETIETYLTSEISTITSCYLFCLERNLEFLSDQCVMNEFQSLIENYFNAQFSTFKFVSKSTRMKHMYFPKMLCYPNEINFELDDYLIRPLCDHFADEISLLETFLATYRTFIFKWRIFPTKENSLKGLEVFKDLKLFQPDFTNSQIAIDSLLINRTPSAISHRLDYEFIKKQLLPLNKSKTKRDLVLQAIRIAKMAEEYNQLTPDKVAIFIHDNNKITPKNASLQWPPNQAIKEKLLGRSQEKHELSSNFTKSLNSAIKYIQDPWQILQDEIDS